MYDETITDKLKKGGSGGLIENRLSFFAKLFQVDQNPELGMWLLYCTIVILSAIAYHLGFAQKLPILKRVIVYIFLLIGSSILSFLGTVLPVAEGLLVIVLVLTIYRIRRNLEQKRDKPINDDTGLQRSD